MPARASRRKRQNLFLLLDVVVLCTALALAMVVRNGHSLGEAFRGEYVRVYSFVVVAWIVTLYVAGLYSLEASYNAVKLAQRTFGASAIASLLTALIFYTARIRSFAPKTILAAFSLFAFAGLWSVRFVLGRVARRYFPRIGVAFVGATAEAIALATTAARQPLLGFDVRLLFSASPQALAAPPAPVIQNPRALAQTVRESGVSLVVIAQEAALDPEVERQLFGLLENRTRFRRLPDFYETLFRRVPVGAINDTWFLENIDLQSQRPYEFLKRGIDILLAALVLVVTCPLWPFIALAIKLESPGPVFFRQVRLGRFNEPFTMLKFRSMRTDGNDFAPTGVGDKRVTSLGSFMRATRLDELPQAINILWGEMSFVGPRPERPELAAELEKAIPYYRQRHLVKPGITGWDQVSGEYHSPSVEDTYKKLQYDLYYIKNMSLFLDLSILLKTVATVLSRAGR